MTGIYLCKLEATFNTHNRACDLNSFVWCVWDKGVFPSAIQNYIQLDVRNLHS